MVSQSPTPETINRLTDGVFPAFALLAGMQLDLFTPLKDGPKSAAEVAAAIGADAGKLELLMYALVAADLLEVDDGAFSNTPEAGLFLVKGLDGYMGHRGDFFQARWRETMNTAESVRTGEAQAKLEFSAMSEQDVGTFLLGLHPETVAAGRGLTNKFDFSSRRSLIDIGGGTGGLSIALLERNPQLEATVLDLPTVTPITRQIVDESSVADRIQVVSGNAVDGPISGSYDVAVMRAFIQVLSEDESRRVIQNVSHALETGGDLYILGRVLDDSRETPRAAALFNLVFLNVYDGGQAYTESQHRDWLTDAGFGDFKHEVQPNGTSIVSARKLS